MITFKVINQNNISWTKIEESDATNIYHTRYWFSFLKKSQCLSPIVAEIIDESGIVGYLISSITHKFGCKILGSPFRGWNSEFMGLILNKGVSYNNVLKKLPDFAFNQIGCHYLEIVDPRILPGDLRNTPYRVETLKRFSFCLSQSEDELFEKMDHDRQANIRKAIRSGITIEESHDIEFAAEYYSQLKEVFSKQSLETPYSLKRVQQLIKELLPTQNILLLRAKNAEGECIATSITIGFNKTSIGWGLASQKKFQILRPVELLYWHSLIYWKSRGFKEFHIGGGWSKYKKSYGCDEIQVQRLMLSKNRIIDQATKYIFTNNNSRFKNFLIKHF
jgi:hypothetical protein